MNFKLLLAGVMAATLTAVVAHADTIDFTAYAPGTPLASADGVTFSLIGGPGTNGTPLIGLACCSPIGLENSDTTATFNGYPTSNILDFQFSGPVSNVSFFFNNYGSGNGSFYDAFAGATLVASGSLDGLDGTSSTGVAGSGITDLQFNNNEGGDGNWVFNVQSVTFTGGAVPEPATWAMMLVGFGGLGASLRTARRKRAMSVA